ncbi:hypothetical protein INP77_05360 [Methylophilus sp. 13]|uniref:hypothetical protein n=1 Tax=Methylophilus sp. 13 TaxID=2781018 RepID=UPI00188F353E|nr:hypothetical protein [Methylophilus sp. 13]MBF5038917.1 hypothetical protein [Methylophilus sp. 13]
MSDITKVTEVIELRVAADVNKYLKLGWCLLRISSDNSEGAIQPNQLYTLGWAQGGEAIHN